MAPYKNLENPKNELFFLFLEQLVYNVKPGVHMAQIFYRASSKIRPLLDYYRISDFVIIVESFYTALQCNRLK